VERVCRRPFVKGRSGVVRVERVDRPLVKMVVPGDCWMAPTTWPVVRLV